MIATWVQEEISGVDLEDERLNKRLGKLLSDLGDRPTLSIPAACGGRAEMTAAYRFFDNDNVSYEKIMAPHRERTLQRAQAESVVVLVADTTELDLTRPKKRVKGDGPLATATAPNLARHLTPGASATRPARVSGSGSPARASPP